MMYVALKEKRISTPVVLEIKLEVVSRPGVLFCAVNAARNAAKASEFPRAIRFEVVKAQSQYDVDESLRPFYQGEVLVPGWIPPHLIKIQKVDAFLGPLELRGRSLTDLEIDGRLPAATLVECSTRCEVGDRVPEPPPPRSRSDEKGRFSL